VNKKAMSFKETENLYTFLQGDVPEEISLQEPPQLSEKMAFGVIYYLQEIVGIIPDHYERCNECSRLYDSDDEGESTEDGTFCDYHRPDETDGDSRKELIWEKN